MHYRPEPVTYAIRPGDNLYQLSRHYKTTVLSILKENPEIDPYDLREGARVRVVPGAEFSPHFIGEDVCPDPVKQFELLSDMRYRWAQHVYWTRMLLVSIAERLKDLDAVEKRLLQNPADIAGIFGRYYNADTARAVEKLLTEHLQIGAALITALRDKKAAEAETLKTKWYANAVQMAEAFAGINPFYSREELLKMLDNHLDLTTREVAARLIGDYPADIEAFDAVEEEALSMADYFSVGILRQFPQSFM